MEVYSKSHELLCGISYKEHSSDNPSETAENISKYFGAINTNTGYEIPPVNNEDLLDVNCSDINVKLFLTALITYKLVWN